MINIRIATIVTVITSVISINAVTSQNTKNTKPNIVYILADDMGVGDVMAYNKNSKILTPNIDKLANEGMLFTDAHTSSGVCTPTRYGIITGRYSWRTRLKKGVLNGNSPHLIDLSRETVASLLKKQGYKTACVGKWHLGLDWNYKNNQRKVNKRFNTDFSQPIKNGPLNVGFDYYFGIPASLNMNPHLFIDGNKAQGTFELLKNSDAVKNRGFIGAKPGWAAKEFVQDQVLPILTKKTCNWIKKNADEPFFVYMPLNSPHSPIVPSKNFKGKSNLNAHGDFCMETDWAVGEVLKTLDELGISENTIVIFTADNGTSPKANFELMAKKGHHPSWIYRGQKGTNWEGGHRVPYVMRWPKEIKAKSVSKALICTTDLMSTCAELLNVNLKDNTAEDSFSFLSILKGGKDKQSKQRNIVHHSDKGIFSIRSGKWKLMFDNYGGSGRTDPRKNEPIINDAQLQLFDMENDPTENINLANKYPKTVEQLKKTLAEIIKKGRSTPGKPQKDDVYKDGKWWEQTNVVKDYL